jgi:hypothetical protein
MDIKFTQSGEYLIAAGSELQEGQELFSPVLYISVIGGKGWATRYPLDGTFAKDDDASAEALRYGIQIITLQVKDVLPPGSPPPPVALNDSDTSARDSRRSWSVDLYPHRQDR